jgi:sucrose phosphorylase
MLITETNLPDHENLSYFGEYDEANAIYNFGLPPMLLWTMAMGDSTVIRKWLMSMPPAKEGTCYLNFIASHDGIGLRPTEGILTDDQRKDLVEIMKNFGAQVSYRKNKNDKELPYEINISLLDAMKGSKLGEDHLQVERLLCIHAIMLGLEGIPALYIHSLIGSENDYELMDKNQNKRSINRSQLEYNYLKKVLSDTRTKNYKIFHQLKKIIQLKRKQNGFHPNATQFTFNLGINFFALWRQSLDKKQSIFCISNITNVFQYLDLSEVNLIATENWSDLITGEKIKDIQGTVAVKAYQTLWISNV